MGLGRGPLRGLREEQDRPPRRRSRPPAPRHLPQAHPRLGTGSLRLMTIIPDTKDWTWVLRRPCPECGFDTQGFAVQAVPGMIMANAAAWQPALEGDARTRP